MMMISCSLGTTMTMKKMNKARPRHNAPAFLLPCIVNCLSLVLYNGAGLFQCAGGIGYAF